MLPNEKFALECRAYYDENGLVVDERNGEFAHCPYPKRMGDSGYYLLWEHHQQQGLLQSNDLGRCCFFAGHAKQWLENCYPFPDNYFDLWDIYEKYVSLLNAETNVKLHAEKDECGRSIHAVKMAEKTHEERNEDGKSAHGMKYIGKVATGLHSEKDESGKSVYAINLNKILHAKKDESGKSLHTMNVNRKLHGEKDENGKSLHAIKMGKEGGAKIHAEKDENGKSLHAIKMGNRSSAQIWVSTVDGFRSSAAGVAHHNRANGWDPKAKVRVEVS